MTRTTNIYFVTVGTSIAGNAAAAWRRLDREVPGGYGPTLAWLADRLQTDGPNFLQELADGDRPASDHHPILSAEISSLFADRAPHPRDGDTIILITSDSDDGRVAGRAVGEILAGWLNCGFLDLTGDERLEVTLGAVHAVTATGLEVDNIDEFTAAVTRIGEYLALAFDAVPEGGTLIIHPTGGFKATVPMLTNLASHLPSTRHTEMWMNHERTQFGIPIPVQCNEVSPDHRADLRDTDQGRQDYARSRWLGYAWGDDGKLTAVGEAILRMDATLHPDR